MNSIEKYNSVYKMMRFERKNLFKLISNKYKIENVLYPGSSIHITPSFFFRFVVYLDQAVDAEEFFSQEEMVEKLIAENKTYNSMAHYSFIKGDYSKLEMQGDYKFDLLISLYADDVVLNSEKYLRKKAIVLSNNYHDEARELQKNQKYKLIAIIQRYKEDYKLTDVFCDYRIAHRNEEKIQKKCMVETNEGIKYIDNEVYYVFEFED